MLTVEAGKSNSIKPIKATAQSKEKFRKIYNQFSSQMYSLCLRYCVNTKDAETNFINGITLCYKNFASANGVITATTARKIFVDCCVDFLKEKETNLFKNIPLYADDLSRKTGTIDHINTMQLIQLIQQLPTDHRILVNLWFVEEYSIEEIGNLLLINEISAKSLLSKATSVFKKSFQQADKLC